MGHKFGIDLAQLEHLFSKNEAAGSSDNWDTFFVHRGEISCGKAMAMSQRLGYLEQPSVLEPQGLRLSDSFSHSITHLVAQQFEHQRLGN